jgi:hypothetical protein
MGKDVLKTDYQREKDAKDMAIYEDWRTLMGKQGAMATAVNACLMEKYNIHAPSTIWVARQRAAKRLKEQKEKENAKKSK